MGILVANDQGAIDRSVSRIAVANDQGAIDKEVQGGYVADAQGAIDRQFYANWVYYSGTLYKSVSDGTTTDGGTFFDTTVTMSPAVSSYYVKLKHMYSAATISANASTTTVRSEIQYKNADDEWITIISKSKTVTTTPQTIIIDQDVSGDIITKQVRYVLYDLTGNDAERYYWQAKCTEWYKRG